MDVQNIAHSHACKCKNVHVMCMRVQPKFFPYYQCYDWIKTCMGIKMGQNSKLQFAPSLPQIWHPVHSQGSKSFSHYPGASNKVHSYQKWMKKFMFSPKLTFIYLNISKLSNVHCFLVKKNWTKIKCLSSHVVICFSLRFELMVD